MKKWNNQVLLIAVASTILLLIGSFFVNLNGAYPYLNRSLSLVLTTVLFIAGFGCSIGLFFLKPPRHILAGILLILLVAMILPLFW
jgi:hypothetical protein